MQKPLQINEAAHLPAALPVEIRESVESEKIPLDNFKNEILKMKTLIAFNFDKIAIEISDLNNLEEIHFQCYLWKKTKDETQLVNLDSLINIFEEKQNFFF